MFARPFPFAFLAAPFLLSSCGVATRVQTAFSSPASQLKPVRGHSAPRAGEFDSLAASLHTLDKAKLDDIIARWKSAPTKRASLPTRAALQPSVMLDWSMVQAQVASSPLLSLRGKNDLTLAPLSPVAPEFGERATSSPLRFEAPRTLRAVSALKTGLENGDVRAFLSSWAARQSLARADEEWLGRRALNERIALQSRGTLPEVDLSLVPPEVQLELTNLRLQLIPLLSIPAAQKVRAQDRIDAIEARLRVLWTAETARQARLWRQSFIEVPARLAREGDAALQGQTRRQASLDSKERARVQGEAHALLQPRALPPLLVHQNGTLAPDATRVRARLQAPFTSPSRSSSLSLPLLPGDDAPISIRTLKGVPPSTSARAARQARLWSAAVR